MIRIAICDDEASQAREIARIVGNFFQKQEIAHRIDLFSSGEALLKDQEFIDVVFLDIQMGGIDGIETAQELRNRDTRTVLFFITSYSQHIMRSMTIHPFAFLVKPVEEKQLVQIFMKDTRKGCLDMSKAGELGIPEAYEILKQYTALDR